MALRAIPPSRDESELLKSRFQTAQADPPEDIEERKRVQRALQADILATAYLINDTVEDGRAKALALTHLEEALMWAGKAIFA